MARTRKQKLNVVSLLGDSTAVADPDQQNEDRAEWAAKAVEAFMLETGLGIEDGLETAVMDLLCDLGHFCDRTGLDLCDLLDRAASHYGDETLRSDDDGPEIESGLQFGFAVQTKS